MKKNIKKIIGYFLVFTLLIPSTITRSSDNYSTKIIYPLQNVAKLECRFQKFSELDSSCIESLPVLKSSQYSYYASLNGGFNDYTRRYTVLWGSSYTYGWDVGNGGHMGVDIVTSEGTPVYAVADGEVIIASKKIDFGNLVSIRHKINGKTIVTNYAHLSKINVKVGDKVNVGDIIGEVGSTGNSSGNHLHFQVDLTEGKNPAYYSYDSCPYSYYEIVEQGKCFQELQNLTLDPLVFLETSGAVLDSIIIKETKSQTKKNNSTSSNENKSSNSSSVYDDDKISDSVFTTQLYYGSSSSSVKEAQKLMKYLGYYNGKIDGDYNSVADDIIDYQYDNDIIPSKNDEAAGHFGPLTRNKLKEEYDRLNNQITTVLFTDEQIENNSIAEENETEENIETVVEVKGNETKVNISKESLMTREEIEEMELNEFLNKYSVKLVNDDVSNVLKIGTDKKIKLNISYINGKKFVGNTPYPITFEYDTSKISVFPESFYNYTDGERDIVITGIKSGEATINVKMGSRTIKTISLRVLTETEQQNIVPVESYYIISPKVVVGDSNLGVIMLKDASGENLVNLKYKGQYELRVEGDGEICLKSGDLINAKKIAKQDCTDYKKSITFDYDGTVGGLILFNYKIFNSDSKIKLISKSDSKELVSTNIKVYSPKGLESNYEYYDEILEMLENNTLSYDLTKGYFLEKRELTQRDANNWLISTLTAMKQNTGDNTLKAKIDENLAIVSNRYTSASKSITRKEFLEDVYKYLVFDKTSNVTINYKDLGIEENVIANAIFDSKNTWKDSFGDEYYKPNQIITRGEGAYLLAKAYNKTSVLTVVYAK